MGKSLYELFSAGFRVGRDEMCVEGIEGGDRVRVEEIMMMDLVTLAELRSLVVVSR